MLRPADSFCPGQTPAQEARCAASGKTLMSTSISVTMTCAVISESPGIVAIAEAVS